MFTTFWLWLSLCGHVCHILSIIATLWPCLPNFDYDCHTVGMYICAECTFATNLHLQGMYIHHKFTFARNVHSPQMYICAKCTFTTYIRAECTFTINVHSQWMYIRNKCKFKTNVHLAHQWSLNDVHWAECTFERYLHSRLMYICFNVHLRQMYIGCESASLMRICYFEYIKFFIKGRIMLFSAHFSSCVSGLITSIVNLPISFYRVLNHRWNLQVFCCLLKAQETINM